MAEVHQAVQQLTAQLAQTTAQLAQVLDRLQTCENHLGATTRTNNALEAQVQNFRDRLAAAEGQRAAGGGGGADRGGLYDRKLNIPMILRDGKDFREWADG